MCMGGGQTPQAQVNTPAVPVSDITAGHPTVKVIPPGQEDTGSPVSPKAAPSQSNGATGLNM